MLRRSGQSIGLAVRALPSKAFALENEQTLMMLHQRGVFLGRLGVAGVVFCISHLGRFASWQGAGAWPRAGMAGEDISVATWGGR